MSELRGWESDERVLDSGGFASRQRVLVDAPAVEATEAGARRLGSSYWRAVERVTGGAVRARWRGEGGRLRLFGTLTLLVFGSPELAVGEGRVGCRYPIRGGLLALRPGGSVTLSQRTAGTAYELSVSVEEYVPRLAARVGAPRWTGALYARAQSPFHVAVSRRWFRSFGRGRR